MFLLDVLQQSPHKDVPRSMSGYIWLHTKLYMNYWTPLQEERVLLDQEDQTWSHIAPVMTYDELNLLVEVQQLFY
jgi:hypothetical protein